jgi:peptidoglycan hydrolase CwlO-like protein
VEDKGKCQVNKNNIERLEETQKQHGEKIAELEKKMPKFEYIMQEMINTNKEQNIVMGQLNETISGINYEMKSFKNDLDNTKKDVNNTKKEVEDIKESQNFNFVKWFKKNVMGGLLSLGLGGGGIYAIIEIVRILSEK